MPDPGEAERWASGRGDSLRWVSYAYKDGRRGKQQFQMGFDRRGGYEGFDDGPVERSVPDVSDDPSKAELGPGSDGRPFDPTAAFKEAYKTGRVRFEGERVLRGRPVYVLVVDHPPERDDAGSVVSETRETFIVDRRTYLPIERRSSSENFEGGKRIRGSTVESFKVYEKLPRTPENLAALRPPKER